mgnify:CR=1 FL=1
MAEFIDRQEEIQTLKREYHRDGSSFVVIYGRRRVGKTTLISQFISDKNALFFLATEESEEQNRRMFKDRVAEFLDNTLLKNADINNWDDIFKMLVDKTYESKLVIVIDEFQYIGRSNSAFPSIFQRIWEEILKDANVMVIICGSLISMMESQVLAYNSPLYGRRTAQVKLKQIPFKYYRDFFGDISENELIKRYAVTGGVPKYIELFKDETDIYQAIEHNIVATTSYLYDEPNFLLRQEVTEVGSYFSIIRAIANDNSRLSDIAKVLEIKATSLTKYLGTLIDLDILEREVPVTEDNPEKSKKGLYKIKDNYIRFWFAFIYPNISFIEAGNSEIVMNKIKNNFVDNHVSYVYEDVCREKMWQLNNNCAWPFYFSKIGRYWDAHTEIDICALDPDGKNIIVGECKYWKDKMGLNVLYDLEKKAATIPWNKDDRRMWYVLCNANGYTGELKNAVAERKDVVLM